VVKQDYNRKHRADKGTELKHDLMTKHRAGVGTELRDTRRLNTGQARALSSGLLED
jgi:hypothetical protein